MPSREEFKSARMALEVLAKSADVIEEAFLSVETEKAGAVGSLSHLKKEIEKAEVYLDGLKREIAAANDAAGYARGEANEQRAQVEQATVELAKITKQAESEKRAIAAFKAELLSKISE